MACDGARRGTAQEQHAPVLAHGALIVVGVGDGLDSYDAGGAAGGGGGGGRCGGCSSGGGRPAGCCRTGGGGGAGSGPSFKTTSSSSLSPSATTASSRVALSHPALPRLLGPTPSHPEAIDATRAVLCTNAPPSVATTVAETEHASSPRTPVPPEAVAVAAVTGTFAGTTSFAADPCVALCVNKTLSGGAPSYDASVSPATEPARSRRTPSSHPPAPAVDTATTTKAAAISPKAPPSKPDATAVEAPADAGRGAGLAPAPRRLAAGAATTAARLRGGRRWGLQIDLT